MNVVLIDKISPSTKALKHLDCCRKTTKPSKGLTNNFIFSIKAVFHTKITVISTWILKVYLLQCIKIQIKRQFSQEFILLYKKNNCNTDSQRYNVALPGDRQGLVYATVWQLIWANKSDVSRMYKLMCVRSVFNFQLNLSRHTTHVQHIMHL